MKPTLREKYRVVAIAAAGFLSVTLVAWNHQPDNQAGYINRQLDTVPLKTEKKPELRELEREIEKLDLAIEKLNEKNSEDWEVISRKLRAELNKVNVDEIMQKAELALKDIDFNKMNGEFQKAFKALELELKEERRSESLSELNIEKAEIERAMSGAKTALKKELSEVKKIDARELKEALAELNNSQGMSAMKAELNKAQEMLRDEEGRLKESLEKAKVDLEAAKKDLSEKSREI